MKYFIIPNCEAIEIEATDKDEAIINFATNMDSNMNTYFKVVTEDELNELKRVRDHDGYRNTIKETFVEMLISAYDVDQQDAKNLATVCYDTYLHKDGYSEEDAVTEVFEKTQKSELAALESMCEQYEVGDDFEIEIGLSDDDSESEISIRRYSENAGQAYEIQRIRRSCLSRELIEDLCNKHNWYVA